MSTTQQHLEKLVMEKAQLQQQANGLLGIIGTLALAHGTEKKGVVEYRIPKTKLESFNKLVNIRGLKAGGFVIELVDPPEEA